MSTRIALYARVSSEIQEKEATIESQVALLHEAAKKQGDVVVGEYRDDGFSGDLLARPGLDRLRDDAARKLFDRVLILSPDRLARKWVYGEVIADELRKHGIPIQYLNQKDDGTEEGKLLLGITGLFGQYEKAKMIERIRRGRLYGARSGRLMTSHAPYGYRYIPKTAKEPGRLEICEDEARAIRLIFDLFRKGAPLSEIGAELHRQGVPTPRRRPAWVRSSLMNILRSSTYIGIWHYNKTVSAQPKSIRKPDAVRRRLNTSEHRRPRDQWVPVHGVPAIVDRETFEAVQSQVDRNRQFARRNRKRPYLLAGLCRCGICGRSICGSPSNGYMYYRCTGNFRFAGMPSACTYKATSAIRVDAAIWAGIRQGLSDPVLLAGNAVAVREKLAEDVRASRGERDAIIRQIANLKAAETRLLDAYGMGAMELEQLREQMQKSREKRDALARGLEEAGKEEFDAPADRYTLGTICAKVAQGLAILDNDFEARQRFVRMLVEKVVLKPGAAAVIGSLPLAPESLAEPPELFRTLEVGSFQQRSRNAYIRFELAVAL